MFAFNRHRKTFKITFAKLILAFVFLTAGHNQTCLGPILMKRNSNIDLGRGMDTADLVDIFAYNIKTKFS